MRVIILAVLFMLAIWPSKGQIADIVFPTQRDQGLTFEKLEKFAGNLVTTGFDVPMFGQDSLLYPFIWRGIVVDRNGNNVIRDSSVAINFNQSLGFVMGSTDTSLLTILAIDDTTSSTGVFIDLQEINSAFELKRPIFRIEFPSTGNFVGRLMQWKRLDSVAYLGFHGDTVLYVIGPNFSLLDTLHLPFPVNTNKRNTPIHATRINGSHFIYQAVSEYRQSNCLSVPCNNLQIRRLNVGSGQISTVNFPVLPQFQPTGSTFLGPAFKNTDIKDFNNDTLIGIALANSHNRPPYISYSNYDIAMSNQLVVYKFAKDLNVNSFTLKFIPSNDFPIYTNDETTLDLVHEDYIYVAATQVDDYIYRRPTSALPYWSYFFTGIETRIKLFCLDKHLNIRWQTEIYDQGTEKHLVDIVALPDSGVALLLHESSRTSFTNPMNLRLLVYNKNGTGTTSQTEDIKPEKLNEVVVFPNPASGQVSIRNADFKKGRLVNALGQTVMTFQPADSGETTLDIGHLTGGIYHLVLEAQNQTVEARKLVIQQLR